VTWVDTAPGETVDEGQPLFVLSDLDTVWVSISVAGDDIGRVLDGTTGARLRGTLTCRNLPGGSWAVDVDTRDAVVDETSGRCACAEP